MASLGASSVGLTEPDKRRSWGSGAGDDGLDRDPDGRQGRGRVDDLEGRPGVRWDRRPLDEVLAQDAAKLLLERQDVPGRSAPERGAEVHVFADLAGLSTPGGLAVGMLGKQAADVHMATAVPDRG